MLTIQLFHHYYSTKPLLHIIPKHFPQSDLFMTITLKSFFPLLIQLLCYNSCIGDISFTFAQALNVIGQAGKPRTISGFQTHQTPVRLGTAEHTELATEEFIQFAHVLEGFVMLQKNPGLEKMEV